MFIALFVSIGVLLPLCRQHPWFTLHLPRYLAVMQADTIASVSHLDDELLDEVARMGFDRTDVEMAIKRREQNKVRAAVHTWANIDCTDCTCVTNYGKCA